MDVQQRIREHIESQPVTIFMKGSPEAPQCGFSARTAEALKDCERPFQWVNVLADQEIRSALPQYADWPTFPQVFIDGELVGGCDITLQLHEQGELKPMIQKAADARSEA
ncbi:MAG: monothiol glutaredoxin, Grx4 family [Proteobacteria bacterium SW_6_67_9]|nr:MAG: monothiol glutaredoxin, Grx4 family [Proteobacteria bacterium SW_6_67_9]